MFTLKKKKKKIPKVPNPVNDPPLNNYDPSKKCAFHYYGPEHDIKNFWTLKNKIQDLIDAKVVQFPKEASLNITTHPLSPHGDKVVNAIIGDEEEEISYMFS